MIKQQYDDGKDHVHVLSYGGGTQSTALLLMALKGEINGVIPDYIIFSDTGWEPKHVYNWIEKINKYIKATYGREIIFCDNGNIRDDIVEGSETGNRFASIPFFTKDKNGEIGIARRQCTNEYKILPVNRKIRSLLGYKPRQRIKEVVHLWKGISTDEIQRVKPSRESWQVAEHPLVDVAFIDRSRCITYVEREGLGTPDSLDYGDSFLVFESDHDIECWLESDAWDDWALWELNDIEGSLNEDVMVWKFHRNICKEKWEISYRDSKPFINGWSRQRKKIGFEAVPSFSLN